MSSKCNACEMICSYVLAGNKPFFLSLSSSFVFFIVPTRKTQKDVILLVISFVPEITLIMQLPLGSNWINVLKILFSLSASLVVNKMDKDVECCLSSYILKWKKKLEFE